MCVMASVGSTLYLASLHTTNERLRRLRAGQPRVQRRAVPILRRRWAAIAGQTRKVA